MVARRADELSGLGRWRKACAEYERHLSAHPEDVDARQGLGAALLATADAAGAVAEFDRVLAAEPDRFTARYQRAVALAALQRDHEAIDDLDRLIAAEPGVWYLWSDRGGVQARAGRLDDALRDLAEAVRLAPGEAVARLNLGLLLARAERFAEAHRHLAHAALAGAPGAARARDSVRHALLAGSSADDVEQAVVSVLTAASTHEVATFADAHPFVLTEGFVDMLVGFADTPELMFPSDAWRRVEDLRLLLDDATGTPPVVAGFGSFGLLVDRLAELHERGDHAAAFALAPQVTRRAEEEFGAGSVEHARQFGSWAVLALRVDSPDAEELYRVAHDLLSRVDPAALVRLLVSRAAVRTGAEAEQALEEALAVVRDPAVHVEHADVLRAYRTEGARLSRTGRYAEAEQLLREAVTRVEGDPLADLCSALAEAVFRQGRIADALPWCEQVLAIRRAEHGETHDLVAAAMRDLGHVHTEARDIGAAESWLMRAADTWRRLPGHDGDVAGVEADLATLYATAGLAEPARAAAARALEALDRLPEPDDSALLQVGNAYQTLHDDESARAVLERLVEVRRVRVPLSASLASALNALANTHYWAGRFDLALTAYQESLRIIEAVAPGDVDAAFTLRHNVANVLHRQGHLDAAFAAHNEAITEYRRHLPGNDPKLLQAVLAVADLHRSAGDEARAEELLVEVRAHLGGDPEVQAADLLDRARTALHDDRPDEAELLFGRLLADAVTDRGLATVKFGLARARLLRGTRTGVIELLRESLDLCEDEESADVIRVELAEALGHAGQDDEAVPLLTTLLDREDERHRGRALAALGAAMQRRGALPRAQQLLREAVTFADVDDVADNRIIGRRSLALALVRTHDLDEAYETSAAAIDLALNGFGPDSRLTALAELTYASVLTADGRPADAEPIIRRALVALERILRPEHPDLVSAMNDLANSLLLQGEPYRAIPWFRRALTADAELGGASGAAIARNLAVTLADLGDFATARDLVTEAMNRIQTELGSEHPSYGVALATLGQVELADGDLDAASNCLVAACRILDNVLGPDHENAFTAKSHLAGLYLTIGAHDTALSFAVSAERAATALYGADNPSLAPHRACLARAKAFTGDPDEAERLYQEALALVPWSREFLLSLAELQIAIGKHDEALATLERTIAQEDADLPRSLPGAAGPQRTAGFARLQRTVHDYLNLLVRIGDQRLVRPAWELTVRRRGLDADYLELRATVPKSAEQRRELAHVRADISRAVLMNAVDDLSRLRRRRDELEQLLAARVPTAVLVDRVGSVDAGAVIAALPPDTTLIDVVRTKWIDFANKALGTPPDREGLELDRTWLQHPTRYLAFILTAAADSDIRMVDLGPTDIIDDHVRRLRGAIYRRSPDPNPDPEAADALSASVLMPLLPHVSTNRLLVTADGPIAELPWQILPTGPGRLLVDDHTIGYLSSPREVLRWKADGPTTPPLVVGDPDFDLDAPPPPHGLPRLPGTRDECADVAELLAVEPLLDRSASKSAVLGAHSPTVLHLATHGLFLPPAKPPKQDNVYDTIHVLEVPGEGAFVVNATRRRSRRPDVDPLLSSAVALAGFNAWIDGRPTPSDVDSGVLTADEVCGMELHNTRLVVLSACETGLGDHRPGEGVLGLRWALAVAGARTVVTTLWKVPDAATRELMVLFYQRLLFGDPAPEALCAAQRTMRQRGSDVRVWGAFVVHGKPTGILR